MDLCRHILGNYWSSSNYQHIIFHSTQDKNVSLIFYGKFGVCLEIMNCNHELNIYYASILDNDGHVTWTYLVFEGRYNGGYKDI